MPGFNDKLLTTSIRTEATRTIKFIKSKVRNEQATVLAEKAGRVGITAPEQSSAGTPLSPELPSELLYWKRAYAMGPGLRNVGNTCFLNSTLQVLFYSSPLAEFLLQKTHSSNCKVHGFCCLCEMEKLTCNMHTFRGKQCEVNPMRIAGNLKAIATHMRLGRQEDAHEFLRYVVELMVKNDIGKSSGGRATPEMEARSTVFKVFGGHAVSCVECANCHNVSKTYDPIMDIHLDVRKSQSVDHALKCYSQWEHISDSYKCDNCKKKVNARKRTRIFNPPEILSIQLKLFDPFQRKKLNKRIKFETRLDLASSIDNEKVEKSSYIYDLYAIIVHQGGASCGHYFSYVKSSSGLWYCKNDSSVSQVSVQTVLSANAYILFYQRHERPASISTNPHPIIANDSIQASQSHSHIALNNDRSNKEKNVDRVVKVADKNQLSSQIDIKSKTHSCTESKAANDSAIDDIFATKSSLTLKPPSSAATVLKSILPSPPQTPELTKSETSNAIINTPPELTKSETSNAIDNPLESSPPVSPPSTPTEHSAPSLNKKRSVRNWLVSPISPLDSRSSYKKRPHEHDADYDAPKKKKKKEKKKFNFADFNPFQKLYNLTKRSK